jgi:RHS repeat-associated protein
MAQSNPFRFSTKFTDNESGLLYYGQRFLNADLGRWINRDPLGEQGGENLFAFIANKGLNNYDPVGTTVPGTSEDQIEAADIAAEMGAEGAGNALNILMRVRKMALASNAYQRLGAAILGSGAAAEQEEYGMMESFLAEGNAIIAQGIRSGQRITTVLGRYKTDMYQFFDDGKLNQWGRQWQALGHNILSIAKDVKDPARLSANFQWLAQAVARGDRIYIATKVTDIGGETYPMELDFLKLLGYVREGDYMVRH